MKAERLTKLVTFRVSEKMAVELERLCVAKTRRLADVVRIVFVAGMRATQNGKKI